MMNFALIAGQAVPYQEEHGTRIYYLKQGEFDSVAIKSGEIEFRRTAGQRTLPIIFANLSTADRHGTANANALAEVYIGILQQQPTKQLSGNFIYALCLRFRF